MLKKALILEIILFFGENVKIYDHSHIFTNKEELIKNSGYLIEEIEIGSNTWICSNVVILKGAKVGKNCVIGVNEVVKENIENNMIYSNKTKKEIIYK